MYFRFFSFIDLWTFFQDGKRLFIGAVGSWYWQGKYFVWENGWNVSYHTEFVNEMYTIEPWMLWILTGCVCIYTYSNNLFCHTFMSVLFFWVNCPTALAFIIANYAIVSTVVNFLCAQFDVCNGVCCVGWTLWTVNVSPYWEYWLRQRIASDQKLL